MEQGGRCRLRPRHDLFHLEQDDVGQVQAVLGPIEHPAHGALLGVGQEGSLHRGVLDQQAKAGQVALFGWRRAKAAKRGPDWLLDLGAIGQALLREDGHHPVERVRPAVWRVDAGERLERGNAIASEIDGYAAHAEQCGARGSALVEHEDLGPGEAPPLKGEKGEQDGFARAGRSDHHGVADIADMKVEPERRRSVGLRDGERRRVEVTVAGVPGPRCRERCDVREVERRDHGVADVCVRVPRKARQPGFDCVERLGDSDEAAGRNDPLRRAQLLIGVLRCCSHDNQRRGQEAEADQFRTQLLQGLVDLLGFCDGVRVGEGRRFLGQHLLDQRAHRLVLGKPEPAPFDEFALRFLAIEAQIAGHPAIGHRGGVEVIEHAGMGEGREALDREHAEMFRAQHRRDTADEWGVA